MGSATIEFMLNKSQFCIKKSRRRGAMYEKRDEVLVVVTGGGGGALEETMSRAVAKRVATAGGSGSMR